MTYCYYIVVSLALVVIQTTLIPYFPLFDKSYDLLVLFVVYLGLFCPVREGFPVVIVLGFVMDSLSGGLLGLYITIYFWLFVGVIWIITFLHIRSSLLLPIVIASVVLIENFLLIAALILLVPDSRFPEAVFNTVTIQVLLAVCTGPFLILILKATHKGWQDWLGKHFTRQNGHNV